QSQPLLPDSAEAGTTASGEMSGLASILVQECTQHIFDTTKIGEWIANLAFWPGAENCRAD
ncbi:MAG: hypothetical protein VX075_11735, partial [Pseudomonadota bacterium]|nr:hypothetical protein [Pseudomonadota bacterium]